MALNEGRRSWLRWLWQKTLAAAAAVACTLAVFLVLPLMQTLSQPEGRDLLVRAVDVADLPPPPPPLEEEQREEETPPEAPPELVEEAPPLDLQQLELALNPGFGEAMFGDVGVKLASQVASATNGDDEIDRIFSMADLDQRPRVIFQTMPSYPPELRRSKRQGTVYVVFLVDRLGRVTSPRVERTTDPAFERPALEAVTQWKFEPGVRNGETVQFKMRVPISFNAG